MTLGFCLSYQVIIVYLNSFQRRKEKIYQRIILFCYMGKIYLRINGWGVLLLAKLD